jgi:hypothetical protein
MDSLEGISTEFWRFATGAQAVKLEYLVIGGMAMNLHGLLRNTIDTDVWLPPDLPNMHRLCLLLKSMGYEESDWNFLRNEGDLHHLVFSIEGPIDFLTTLHPSLDFYPCYHRRTIQSFQDIAIPILSLPDLRESKIRAKREQDLRDVLLIDQKMRQE